MPASAPQEITVYRLGDAGLPLTAIISWPTSQPVDLHSLEAFISGPFSDDEVGYCAASLSRANQSHPVANMSQHLLQVQQVISDHKQQLKAQYHTPTPVQQLAQLTYSTLIRQMQFIHVGNHPVSGEKDVLALIIDTQPITIRSGQHVHLIAAGARIIIDANVPFNQPGRLKISMLDPVSTDKTWTHPYDLGGEVWPIGDFRSRLETLQRAGHLSGYIQAVLDLLTAGPDSIRESMDLSDSDDYRLGCGPPLSAWPTIDQVDIEVDRHGRWRYHLS